MAGPFTPETYQSGDGNLSEPITVGRLGQPVRIGGGTEWQSIGSGPVADRPSAADFGVGTWLDPATGSYESNGVIWSDKSRINNATILNKTESYSVGGSAKTGNLILGKSAAIITDTTRYNAFPGLAELPNGDLFAIYRGGATHITVDGKLYYKTSSDKGVTWSSETILLENASLDLRDPEVTLLSTGDLIISYFAMSSLNVPAGLYIMIVDADTLNPTTPILAASPSNGFAYLNACTSKVIELDDGSLMIPMYGNSSLGAIMSSAIIKSSNYGTTWSTKVITAAAAGSDQYNEANGVILDSGRIVLIIRHDAGTTGYARVYSDDNGLTWSTPTNVITGTAIGRPSVTLLGSGGLFLTGRASAGHIYATSWDDGATWSALSVLKAGQAVYSSSVLLSGGEVATMYATEITTDTTRVEFVNFIDGYGIFSNGNANLVSLKSSSVLINGRNITAGQDWVARTTPVDNQFFDVAYGNNLFVAVAGSGTGNRVMTSPDGIRWTIRTTPADNTWISITYGNGLFVAVASTGTGNRVMTSIDGITWTLRTSAADTKWTSVTYGKGLFVAVGWDGGISNSIMTSPDGVTWTLRTAPNANQLQAITYGNGLFVAVSINGTLDRATTSPDGITWTSRTTPNNLPHYGICYGNGLFVAVANPLTGNKLMTSPDGIVWTERTPASDSAWKAVTYGHGLFVAVSDGGPHRIMTSYDGITWEARVAPTANAYFGVTYANSVFVAVGYNGTLNRAMTSGELDIISDQPNNIYQGGMDIRGGIILQKTITAAGTTGAQTINHSTGSVNFAASAASLVVTNDLVTENSIIQCTIGTNDATMKGVQAVAAAGSFTIYPNAVPTAETRVNFTVTN
jgi:hypothetical protein